MKLNSFRELFVVLLSDVYQMQLHYQAAFPGFSKKIYSEELKTLMKDYHAESKVQLERIEKVFRLLGEEPKKVDWSHDTRKFFADIEKFLADNPTSALVDSAIIALAQRIEHIKIATYGTLAEYADIVESSEIKSLITACLKAEWKADAQLTKVARGKWFRAGVNKEATHNIHSAAGAK